ncbi:hypothetical protein SPBRAN_1453 [uncultured Candidatus Thioglobus sp.]|nr:hypothetical protein SPBRAN_1453 [uncultured Candidatus Thioglobus sp.]
MKGLSQKDGTYAPAYPRIHHPKEAGNHTLGHKLAVVTQLKVQ